MISRHANPNVFVKRMITTVILLLSLCVLNAQNQRITGKVTDDSNNPLPGVAVYVSGSQSGELTSENGTYSIQAKMGDVIVFSALGYSEEQVVVSDKTVINIRMKIEAFGLDETVIIGYGTQSKKTITAAVAKISGDVMLNNPIDSPGDALKGRIAGARVYTNDFSPGKAPVITIRGGSSINGSNNPLVLVDGIERGMEAVNPNDIESIQVLKDASATAIYGSRGSNGIILVTTKQGTREGKPRITFEATVGVQGPERRYDLMGAEEYLSYARPGLMASPAKKQATSNSNSVSGNNISTSIYTTRFLKEGEAVPEGYKSMPDPVDPTKTLIFKDTDWQSVLYNETVWQNYYVGVDGGSKNTKYAASVGYMNNEGVAIGSGYNRFTTKMSLNSTITDKLEFRGNIDFSETHTEGFKNQRNEIARAILNAPTASIYFDDGTLTPGQAENTPNPLFTAHINDRYNEQRRITLSGGLTWHIINGLKADVLVAKDYLGTRGHNAQIANYYSTARALTEEHSENSNDKIEALIDYNKTFRRHSVSAMAGYSFIRNHYTWFYVEAEGSPSDKLLNLSNSPILKKGSSNNTDETLMGYFGRLNYDYAKKYLLSMTFRADASSRFAKGNKWGFFPAASAGWIISEEPFMKDVSNTLSFLKFRASLGQTGNNAVGFNDALGGYTNTKYDSIAATIPDRMANESLTWEVTTQLDAGLEFGLFNNRIFFSGDYFRKTTDNLLFSITLPNTSGFSSVMSNVGSVLFHGFDLELSTKNITRKNFTWESNFSWSFVKNRVLSLPDNGRDKNRIGGTTVGDGSAFGGIAEGEPLYGVYAYKVAYIIQNEEQAANAIYDSKSKGYNAETGKSTKGSKYPGDYEWVNREGSSKININGELVDQINDEDMFLMGYTVPHSTGGLGNIFSIGNFTINLYLDWALGHTIIHEDEGRQLQNTLQGNSGLSTKVRDCWTPENPNAKYARFASMDNNQSGNYTRVSSAFTYKGDYLCIRELSLSYKLPKSFLQKLRMSDASIILAGNNLHYFTAVPGVSPERGTDSTFYSGYANYPPIRKVSLGLKVTF